MSTNRADMDSGCPSGAQIFSDPLDGLVWLVAVARLGSVSAAARHLDVPRASLSRRISELEASLGVTLLHRSTRKLTLTRAGEELYRRAQRIVDMAFEAREAVRRLDGVPRGLLRVSVPPRLGERLLPLVSAFLQRYPETRVEIHTAGRLVDLRTEGFDVALRAGRVLDTQLVAHPIGGSELYVVGSPTYFERHGRVESVDDLERHNCMTTSAATGWPLRAGGEVSVKGRLVWDDVFLLRDAALQGLGLALLPEKIIGSELDAGRLQAVLADEVGLYSPFTLLYPSGSLLEPKVRAFVELAVPYLAELRFD